MKNLMIVNFILLNLHAIKYIMSQEFWWDSRTVLRGTTVKWKATTLLGGPPSPHEVMSPRDLKWKEKK